MPGKGGRSARQASINSSVRTARRSEGTSSTWIAPALSPLNRLICGSTINVSPSWTKLMTTSAPGSVPKSRAVAYSASSSAASVASVSARAVPGASTRLA